MARELGLSFSQVVIMSYESLSGCPLRSMGSIVDVGNGVSLKCLENVLQNFAGRRTRVGDTFYKNENLGLPRANRGFRLSVSTLPTLS